MAIALMLIVLTSDNVVAVSSTPVVIVIIDMRIRTILSMNMLARKWRIKIVGVLSVIIVMTLIVMLTLAILMISIIISL